MNRLVPIVKITLIIIVLLFMTIGFYGLVHAAEQPPCPVPTITIKGPCPNPCPQPVACPDMSCPEAPACVCNPAPSIVLPGLERIVSAMTPAPEVYGHWFVPVSALYVNSWGVAAGVGYEKPNRYSLAVQALYLDDARLIDRTTVTRTTVCDDDMGGHCRGEDCDHPPSCRQVSRRHSESYGKSDCGIEVTVAIPIGNR